MNALCEMGAWEVRGLVGTLDIVEAGLEDDLLRQHDQTLDIPNSVHIRLRSDTKGDR